MLTSPTDDCLNRPYTWSISSWVALALRASACFAAASKSAFFFAVGLRVRVRNNRKKKSAIHLGRRRGEVEARDEERGAGDRKERQAAATVWWWWGGETDGRTAYLGDHDLRSYGCVSDQTDASCKMHAVT